MMGKLIDIIEINSIIRILKAYSKSSKYAIFLLDHPSMDVLYLSSPLNICSMFHLATPSSRVVCHNSIEQVMSSSDAENVVKIHYCPNGLISGIVPIIVSGKHKATLIIGQIFFKDPDLAFFRQQAKRYGYNVDSYLETIKNVPVVEPEQFEKDLSFIREIADLFDEFYEKNKKLEETNKSLNKAIYDKERFYSYMSHELRTPLNAILGFSDLLSQQYYGTLSQKQSEYVNLIGSSGQYLLSLVDDLLDIKKINTKEMKINYEQFRLLSCIDDTLGLLKSLFKEKEVTLQLYVEPDLKFIEADPLRLKQILITLINNALKLTPKGKNLKLHVIKHNEHEVKISITEAGGALKEEKLDRIFDDYYENEIACDENLKGTGVELDLTKQLVLLHGGSIGADNNMDGTTTFWFTLPLKQKVMSKKNFIIRQIA